MRVALATHGGQAAAINLRLPPRVLDADGLPPETAQELRRLVAAASTESGGTRRPGPARDAMSYTITVDDGERSIKLSGSDTAMSPAFAALLSWIERHVTT
jgi:hypothetical protein